MLTAILSRLAGPYGFAALFLVGVTVGGGTAKWWYGARLEAARQAAVGAAQLAKFANDQLARCRVATHESDEIITDLRHALVELQSSADAAQRLWHRAAEDSRARQSERDALRDRLDRLAAAAPSEACAAQPVPAAILAELGA